MAICNAVMVTALCDPDPNIIATQMAAKEHYKPNTVALS